MKTELLTDDLAFKYVFSHKGVLEDFIASFSEYVGKENTKPIIIRIEPHAYLSGRDKTIKAYYGDIIAVKDDTIISLEMYKNNFNMDDYNKSLGYLCRLYSNQEKRVKPKDFKKAISINLIKGNFKNENDELVNSYIIKNNKTNAKINDNILLYLVRYDLIDKIPIREKEERFIRYLRMIGSTSIKEMEKYSGGNKKMEETIKFLKEWNKESSERNYNEWREDLRNEGEKRGIKIGKARGIKLGEARGIEESKISIAKELLKDGTMSSDRIIKVTNLSEEELNKIKSEL